MRLARPGRVAAVAAFALVAVACGGGGSGSSSGSNKGTIAIGVDLPESGAAASSGLPTLNGVKFAIQKAGGSIDGWTLAVENRDDAVSGKYNADKGVQNVTDLINTTPPGAPSRELTRANGLLRQVLDLLRDAKK